MLDQILGSKTAQKIFLRLFHYGETDSSAVAKDFRISWGASSMNVLNCDIKL